MKTCHNCEVHSICPELDPIIAADGEELEFCSDFCREGYMDSQAPRTNTVLFVWIDGDVGDVKLKTEAEAVTEVNRYIDTYETFDFASEAALNGIAEASPENIHDLVSAVNHFNWRTNNPVQFFFKEIQK